MHARRLQTAMQAFNLMRLRDEEVDNYIAIIVQKSNPKLDDILRDFDEFIGFFGTKPE